MAVNAIAFVPICAFILHRPWVGCSSSTMSGCSVRAAHTASASFADGNTFSLFNSKTIIGWAVRAIFHGLFLSFLALNVLAPATFVSSRTTGDGGSTAPKDLTAVGTFILYVFLHSLCKITCLFIFCLIFFVQVLCHSVFRAFKWLLHIRHYSSCFDYRSLLGLCVRHVFGCSKRRPTSSLLLSGYFCRSLSAALLVVVSPGICRGECLHILFCMLF